MLSTNALKTVLEVAGPKFEQNSGHKLAITWGTTEQLRIQIEKGTAFDAVVRGRCYHFATQFNDTERHEWLREES